MKADTWIITHAPKFTFSGNASAPEDVNWHPREKSTSSSLALKAIQLFPTNYLADRSMWIPHVDKQILTLHVKVHNVLAMQILHSKSSIHCYEQSLAAINCSEHFISKGQSVSHLLVSMAAHPQCSCILLYIIQHMNIPDHTYLSFFCKTCFRDPFTMYSVTVANVPPGPSRTTP